MNTRFHKRWEYNKNTRIVTYVGYKLGMYDPELWQFISYEGIDIYGEPKYVKLRKTVTVPVFYEEPKSAHAQTYRGEERRLVGRTS